MRVGRRFSLRTLLVVTAVCGSLLTAWRVKVEPYRQQQATVAMVGRLYGSMTSVPQHEPAWQKWLVESALGDGSFVQVIELELSGVTLDRGDNLLLGGLSWVEKINLSRTPLSDEGLNALGSLRRVRELDLSHCGVNDASLVALGDKPWLEGLRLTGCDITDQSIGTLASWRALRQLMIRWTRLSPEGVNRLAGELPDCQVVFQLGGDD